MDGQGPSGAGDPQAPAGSESDDENATDTVSAEGPFQSCINIGANFEVGVGDGWDIPFSRSDVDTIKAAGFEAIRLPIRWTTGQRVNAGGFVDPTFFAELDYIVDYALDTELMVIIDVHHYNEISFDPNAEEGRFLQLWREISAHYRDRSDKLIFEILNEPFIQAGQPVNNRLSIERIDQLNETVLGIIREDSPTKWVILGGGQFGNIDGGQGQGLISSNPPDDDRVMLTFHYYNPFNVTHQGALWATCNDQNGVPGQCVTPVEWGSAADRQNVADDFGVAAAFSEEMGMPIFLGEFGVHGPREGGGAPMDVRVDWTRELRTQAEANAFSWCYWDYQGSFAAYDYVTQSWFNDILSALGFET